MYNDLALEARSVCRLIYHSSRSPRDVHPQPYSRPTHPAHRKYCFVLVCTTRCGSVNKTRTHTYYNAHVISLQMLIFPRRPRIDGDYRARERSTSRAARRLHCHHYYHCRLNHNHCTSKVRCLPMCLRIASQELKNIFLRRYHYIHRNS